jgi:hypothetical protein
LVSRQTVAYFPLLLPVAPAVGVWNSYSSSPGAVRVLALK